MILRKCKMSPLPALLLVLVAPLSIAQVQIGNGPVESGEWIPMRQPCPTCHGEQLLQDQLSAPQQKSGRVLNTNAPFQRNYFQGPQSFRENFIPAQSQRIPTNLQPQTVLIQPSPGNNLPPQFLPPLEQPKANQFQNFQPQEQPQYFLQPQQQFQQPQQQFQQPQQQFEQQPQQFQQQQFYQNLQQPHDDFQLLQQILNNPNNQQYVEQPIYNLNQSQIQTFQYNQPSSTTTPKTVSTTLEPVASRVTETVVPQKTREEVQLLYVPLESLRQNGPVKAPVTEKLYQNFDSLYDFQKQSQLQGIQQDYAQQNFQTLQVQQQLKPAQVVALPAATSPKPVVSTTLAPKKKQKLKPHQPPLAVFMGTDSEKQADVQINDVLSVLGKARTISVLDTVTPKMPQVFVGPSNLQTPNGYAKFDLPYLSNLDNNRIQRKVEQFPFFVAPLSYNVPDGYSKIPFPSPHIGSVVIRDMKNLHNKQNIYEQKPAAVAPPANQFTQNYQTSVSPFTFVSSQNPFEQITASTTPPAIDTTKYYRGSVFPSSVNPIITTTEGKSYYFQRTPKPKAPSTQPNLADYTVLEQFPIRDDPSTTHNILTNLRQAEQTSTNGYFDLSKYRTHPLGINEEIGGLQYEYQKQKLPARQQTNGFASSTEKPYSQSINEEYGQFEYQKQKAPSTIRPTPGFASSSEKPYSQFITPTTTEAPRMPQYSFEIPNPPGEYYEPPVQTNPSQYQQIYNQQFAQIQNSPNPHYQTIPSYVTENSSPPQYIPSITTTTEAPEPETKPPPTNQEQTSGFNLPSALPAINPNLPGLINSLEDGRDSMAESTSPQTATDSTSTKRPIVSRTRQRRPVQQYTTTPAPTTENKPRNTPPRRRRPNPRPEYEKYRSAPTTEAPTTQIPDITTPRITRSRYQNEYTTEAPKRNTVNIVSQTRSRFRSRGRPAAQLTTTTVKPEDMESSSSTMKAQHLIAEHTSDVLTSTENTGSIVYAPSSERSWSTSERSPVFQQPQYESGFQVSPPFMQQALPVQSQYGQEQQYPIYQHEPQEQPNYSTEKQVQEEVSTKRPSYNSDGDSEVISQPAGDDSDYVRFNGGAPQTAVVQTSTTHPRGRSRTRTRGRPLQHQQLQQQQQQLQQQSQRQQSVARSSTEPTPPPAENDDYYGFIRMPTYQQYQPEAVAQPSSTPRYDYDQSQYYSQTERASTVSADTVYVEGSGNTSPSSVNYPNYADKTLEISSAVVDTTTVTEAPTTKKLERTKVRFARPSTVGNPVYTIRPPKRVETPVKITKIGGRIRKPATTTENEIQENASVQPKVSRGHSHFQGPQKESAEKESDNYPEGYLKSHETVTKSPAFKITVAPYDYGDQIPYQSINRPKVVARDPEDGGAESQWSNKYTSTYFRKKNNSNLISTDEKIQEEEVVAPVVNATVEEGKSIFEQIFEEMAKFEGEASTTEAVTETADTKEEEVVGEIKVSKGKRRGFWKRVRVRPVDGLEAAESQNIGNTANLISDSAKLSHPKPTVEQYMITFEPTDNETKVEQPVPETTEKPEIMTVLPVVMTTDPVEEVDTEIPPTDSYHPPELSSDIFESLFNILEPKDIYNKSNKSNEAEATEATTIIPEITTLLPVVTTPSVNIEATENQLNETKIISEKINEYLDQLQEKETKEAKEVKEVNKPLQLDDYLDKIERKEPKEGHKPSQIDEFLDHLQGKDVKEVKPHILGTSTSTEISHETEICYRGRCVKSNTTDSSDAAAVEALKDDKV